VNDHQFHLDWLDFLATGGFDQPAILEDWHRYYRGLKKVREAADPKKCKHGKIGCLTCHDDDDFSYPEDDD
jgi:hypothetical protein